MARKKRTTEEKLHHTLLSGRTDHFRIVPRPDHAKATKLVAPAALTYHNGPLLTSVKVFAFFWGDWTGTEENATRDWLERFWFFVGQDGDNSLMDQLAEYNVTGYTIGRGTFLGQINITNPAPPASLPDGSIQQFLTNQILTNPDVPKPDPSQPHSNLYFVYLPPGVTVSAFSGSSCGGTNVTFCGYHDAIPTQNPATQIFYAVEPWYCANCEITAAQGIDSLTVTSSHELCEAITDPIVGTGWYDTSNGEEIGDLCAWQVKTLNPYSDFSFVIQKEWSNSQNGCV